MVQAALAPKKKESMLSIDILVAAALMLLAAASIASAIMLTAYAFVPCPRARRPLWTCSAAS